MSVALRVVLTPTPPVPSTTPIYKTTLTTTVDETTTTWAAVDIGVEHPKRLIVLAIYLGTSATPATAVTVNGILPIVRLTTSQVAIFACVVPGSQTAEIIVAQTSSLRKVVSVYVAYPNSPFPLDSAGAVAGTTSPAVATDLKVQAGGFVIYAGFSVTTANSFTTTWSGPDAVTEDYDAVPEATGASATTGRIAIVTASSDLDDLTLTALLSGTKAIAAASWGPPPPGN